MPTSGPGTYTITPTRDLTEILAMNIWLGMFGVTALRPDWVEWAAANPTEAWKFRSQADAMLGVVHHQPGQRAARTSHHHSLGWLLA
jgi:hypothetical protein